MHSHKFCNAVTYPNVTVRLLQRELIGPPSGAQVHTARAFSECIIPTEKVLEIESPDAHVGRFTPDGRCLLQSVLLFDYLGPGPVPAKARDEPVGFNNFFKERWRLNLCSGSELLSRDFCLSLRGGAFLLFASSVPSRREGVAAAAEGVAAVAPGAAAAAAAGATPQQEQRLLLPEDGVSENAAATQQQQQQQQRPGSRRLASTDWCELTTFIVVDVQRCMKVDERKFPADYFELNGNGCASLFDSTLAITSTYTQTIHLMQVNADGSLTDMQSIGGMCQADDELPIQLAAAAEQQWWLLQQYQRHQQQEQTRLLAAQQQAKLLSLSHIQQQQQQQQQQGQQQQTQQQDGTAQGQLRLAVQQEQQQQQQQQLPILHPNTLWAQAAAAAIRTIAGNTATSGSPTAAAAVVTGPAAAAAARAYRASRQPSADDSPEDSDDMDRRERRRRIPAGRQQQQQEPSQAQPPGQAHAGHATGVAGAISSAGAGAMGAFSSRQAVAATSAAAAAAATAVLDPDRQLIQGLQQRLLAFFAKRIVQKHPCDVAPSMWDLHYNFDVLSNLAIFRARLLDRQRLLLKLGAPVNGPAAGAEMSPTRPHFFAIYDVVATRFLGFWRPADPAFLGPIIAQPAHLLLAGRDMSPWDRCAAAALYPPGCTIGLSQQQQEEGQEQQQQQRRGSRQISSRGSETAAVIAVETLPGRTAALPLTQQQQQQTQAMQDPISTAAIDTTVAFSITPHGEGSTAAAPAAGAGVSISKDARERVKLIRQLVMLVLPGLQNLSTSPYLDPRLFRYSKHLSPIIGLRNSPSKPLQFMLARSYEQLKDDVDSEAVLARSAETCRTCNGAGNAATAVKVDKAKSQQLQEQRVLFQLQPAQPHTVVWGNEEVARRQLHLFHPTDPFVLTVVLTIAQPAVVSICYRP